MHTTRIVLLPILSDRDTCFLSACSATSPRSAWLPGPSSRSISVSYRHVSSPSSPLTPLVRARSSGFSSQRSSQPPSRGRAIPRQATHWVFAALLTTFFPKMVSAFPPGYVFSFFACMMVLQLLWVATTVPETKGVPLEQIEKQLEMDLATDEL